MNPLESRYTARLAAICLATLLLFSASEGAAQTRQFLDAPVVRSQIRVRWNAAAKTMQWQLDGDANQPFRAIQADTLFLTKRSIYITYPRLNPLSVQATASAVAVEDPAYATITKLVEAITSVATTVAPVAPKGAAPGGAVPPIPPVPCSSATNDVDSLRVQLYGQDTTSDAIRKKVTGWIVAIDSSLMGGKTGPEAMADGVSLIQRDATAFGKNVENAKQAWETIKNCASSAATPASEKGLYNAVSLSDQNPRIQQLTALVAAANGLADLLAKQYGAADKWTGSNLTDYIISDEIGPTFDKMQTITVKVLNVALRVDSTTSALSTDQQAAGTATFNVRRYSSLTPEIGVGAVFGTIKQPKYGTATNANGETVVARVPDSSISVNPTILANFVCRCGTGLLVPMIQVGAATSKDLPSILLGGGLRLFGLGKGDVAIGGGAMFAWYKDLQKLKVGDVITGTKDIDADLGYSSRPKLGAYVAIQYKF